jgi:HAMP domain-containing protein
VPYRPRRAARFAGYALIAVCGLAAMLWPPPSVSRTANSLIWVWIVSILAGGVACAVGAGLDVWLGEYVGLWPLITAFAVFGISALATGQLVSIAGGTCLLAIAFWLLARWQEVAVLRREADRQVQEDR